MRKRRKNWRIRSEVREEQNDVIIVLKDKGSKGKKIKF